MMRSCILSKARNLNKIGGFRGLSPMVLLAAIHLSLMSWHAFGVTCEELNAQIFLDDGPAIELDRGKNTLVAFIERSVNTTFYEFSLDYDLSTNQSVFRVFFLFKGAVDIRASEVMSVDFAVLKQLTQARLTYLRGIRLSEAKVQPHQVVHHNWDNDYSFIAIKLRHGLGPTSMRKKTKFELSKPERFDQRTYREYLRSTYVQGSESNFEFMNRVWQNELARGFNEDDLLFQLLVALPRTNGSATSSFLDPLGGEISSLAFDGEHLTMNIQYAANAAL